MKKIKRELLLIAFGVILFTVLNKFDLVVKLFNKITVVLLPIIFGIIFAFILNVPMRAFEKSIIRITKSFGFNPSLSTVNFASLILSLLSIIAVISLAFTIAIPKLIDSVKELVITIDKNIPDFLIFLESNGIDTTAITNELSDFSFTSFITRFTNEALTFVESAVDMTISAVRFLITFLFGIIISIYLLLDKTNVSRHVRKTIGIFFKDVTVEKIYDSAYLIRDTFAKFITGQCLEAVLLACLMFFVLSFFGFPYASLVALLSAVFSFVPYIGSFVACAFGALLILIDSPQKTLLFVLVYVGIQFIEQQLIYPHVVGTSVGLSPFYTFAAVLIGGNLLGVFGMLFFIPLFSVIFSLLRNKSQRKREHLK